MTAKDMKEWLHEKGYLARGVNTSAEWTAEG